MEKQQAPPTKHQPTSPKKPSLDLTELQRRTLEAIFKQTKRPSKELQETIARQLMLELRTVALFFKNARRRSIAGGYRACKRMEKQLAPPTEHQPTSPKKPSLDLTELQRRTLEAIFKQTTRPSKELQETIARQLMLELKTVDIFFTNARRRSMAGGYRGIA